MKGATLGLTEVNTDDLKKLLWGLHHKHLECPLAIEGLTRIGLQHCATLLLSMLRQLDARAVQAVLVAVIAERLDRGGEQV